MDPYDPALSPLASGLANSGSTCYFNALIQSLISCSSLVRAACVNTAFLEKTRTGQELLKYFRALGLARGPPQSDPETFSEKILAAVVADLAERRPLVCFGRGQESASEALVHILDMLEPQGQGASPITELFSHRSSCAVHCRSCRRVSVTRDHSVQIGLFHLDRVPHRTPVEFARALSRQVSEVDNYHCEGCGKAGPALRVYTLTMVPEILYCVFNRYGSDRQLVIQFPERFSLPGIKEGEMLQYRLVSQIEHSGSLHSGHYWARCLRAGRVYAINDRSVAPSHFAPTPLTYIIVYHYELSREGEAGEWGAHARAGQGKA